MEAKEQEQIKKQMQLEQHLIEYKGDDRVVSSQELKTYLEEISKSKPLVRAKSGFPTLDGLIKTFAGGELNVVSGFTGEGKTLLCQSLTVNFAVQEIYSLWFSYELQPSDFLSKFDESLPLFYLPMTLESGSPGWIHKRIYEAKLKYDIRAVFIDHLHFLSDLMIKRNPSLEIGKVLRILKRWALEFNIMMFLIAHPKMISYERELQAGDIRDSSFIEQEADNVFYIWRLDDTDNEAILKITKNRSRGVRNKRVPLIKIGKYLKERAEDED